MVRKLYKEDPYVRDPVVMALYIAVFFFTVLFILYPLIQGFMPTITQGLHYYGRFFSERLYRDAVINTLIMVVVSTPSAVILGYIYAYTLSKLRIWRPLRRFLTYTVILQLISPPFVTGLAFLLALGRNGIISRGLQDLGLIAGPLDLYGPVGLWIVQTLSFFPVAFLTLLGTIGSLDPTYEQAARVLGVSGFRLFRDIYVRLLYPGILAATILVAMDVMSDFGNPLIVGGSFYVLATLAYLHVAGWGDYVGGAAVAYVLLVPLMILFVVQWRILGRGRYVTITGRESLQEAREPPLYIKIPLLAIVITVSGFITMLYSLIFLGAFTRTWGVDYTLTLKHFEELGLAITNLLRNTMIFAAVSAALCTLVGFLAAYLTTFRRFPLNKPLEVMATVPNAIPGTLLGIAYILSFTRDPLSLVGTPYIIIFNNAARFLPVAFQAGRSSLIQIDSAIEETSLTLGVGTVGTIARVLMPLAAVSLASGIFYSFIHSATTMSAVIFLVSPDTAVLSPFILGLGTHGYWGQAAAVSTILILSIIAALAVFKMIFGGRAKIFGDLL